MPSHRIVVEANSGRGVQTPPPQDLVDFCAYLESAFPTHTYSMGTKDADLAFLHSAFLAKKDGVNESAFHLLVSWYPHEPGHRVDPNDKEWVPSAAANIYRVKMQTGATHYVCARHE